MQEALNKIVEPLIAWYQTNKRPLPWRKDKEPYHVWVSEIMLQQTRIEAVINYYTNFMKELPTVESLSKIPEERLLKLWEGLGYYSRAKNLRRAAEMIMTDYNGGFPDSYDELRKLPGVGEYTAGAVASICFNEKIPAVDGNVLRVVSRIIGSRKDVMLIETKRETGEMLKEVMPKQSGAFNEALMELGEVLCLPNGVPLCHQCPVKNYCTAYRENLTSQIPVRIKKQKRKKEEKTVFILLTGDDEIALEKREGKGLLSGLYQLPNEEGYLDEERVNGLLEEWQIKAYQVEYLKDVKHVFTHVDWYMKGYVVRTNEQSNRFLWVSLKELSEIYPLPTAFQKFIKAIV